MRRRPPSCLSVGYNITNPPLIEVGIGRKKVVPTLQRCSWSRRPRRNLLKQILARGAEAALGEYRKWRKGRVAGDIVNERQMNGLGYDLLYGFERVKDAIDVFKLSVEDYPQALSIDSNGSESHPLGDLCQPTIKADKGTASRLLFAPHQR